MVFVLEYDGKHHSYGQCVDCKYVPCRLPLRYLRDIAVEIYKVIHYRLCTQCADSGTETVCHDNEQSLCAGTDAPVGLSVNKQRTGYVEEIECHTVHNHGKYKHPYAASGIAHAEEPEAQYPCQHGNQHHLLDAEAFQEERYQQDAECFGYLRQRNQDVGMLHSESAGIFGNTAETADVGIGKSVGNLQGNAQQHGENEENSHFLLLE